MFDKDGKLQRSFSSPDGGNTDLNGVVACDEFIAVTSDEGYVYSLSWNGKIRWKQKVEKYPNAFSISDINGDGFSDLLVGDQGTNTLYAFDGKSGSLLWKFKTNGGIDSSPAIGDIDGNGKPEVVFDSKDNNLYALNGEDGSLLWKFETGKSVINSPAIGDIDDDGKLEVVFGSGDKNLYILDGTNGNLKWKYKTGDSILSSPALGDVDGNGKIDIAVASWDGYLYLFEVNRPYGEIVWSRWHGDAQGTGVYQNAKRFALENLNPDPFAKVERWKSKAQKYYWCAFAEESYKPAENPVINNAKIKVATQKALKKAREELFRKMANHIAKLVNQLSDEAELSDRYAREKIVSLLLKELKEEIPKLSWQRYIDNQRGKVYIYLPYAGEVETKASELVAKAISDPTFAEDYKREGLKGLDKLLAELEGGKEQTQNSPLVAEAKEFKDLLEKFNREREETKKVLYEALKSYRLAADELFKYSSPQTQEFIKRWREAEKKVNQLKETFKTLLQKSDRLFSLLYEEAKSIKDDTLRLNMISLIRKREFIFYDHAQRAIRSFYALNDILQKGEDTIKAIKIAGALQYVDKNLYTQIDILKSDADKVFKQLSTLSEEGNQILSTLVEGF